MIERHAIASRPLAQEVLVQAPFQPASAIPTVALQAAVLLFAPLAAFKLLSLVSIAQGDLARRYISAIAAVVAATFAIAHLTRIRLGWRQATYGIAFCLAVVFLVSKFRISSRPASMQLHLQTAQLALVFFGNAALIGAGWCGSQMFSRGVKRSSYLVLAGLAAAMGDMYSVWFGPTGKLIEEHAELVVPLTTLKWFVIGENFVGPVMGIGDILFLGLFLWGAREFRFNLPLNIVAQLIALAVAYAIVLIWNKPLAGLMFIGPVFIAVNWKRFQISKQDWRAIACLVIGLLIAILSLIAIQRPE